MPAPVTLHIYDVFGHDAVSGINGKLRTLGTGAFHGAVEVYGKEWSFGYTEEGTGVFPCDPKQCEPHIFRESADMGETAMSEEEVIALIERLKGEWEGTSYDLLRRNCCSFSDAFCVELGVGHIPKWVNNLAGAGATVMDGVELAASKAQAAAIVAAAKAGEIDSKYNISGTVDAKAKHILSRAETLDRDYAVSSKVQSAAAKASAKLSELHSQAKELDEKHGLSAKANEKLGELHSKAKALDEKHGLSAKAAEGAGYVVAGAAAGASAFFSKLSKK